MARAISKPWHRLPRSQVWTALTAALLAWGCQPSAPNAPGAASSKPPPTPQAEPATPSVSQAPGLPEAVDLSTAMIRVARDALPAVVHIEVTERQTVTNPFAGNPFFEQFFGNQPRKFERVLRGLGSGMIVDDQGHILTNNHVAGGATKIQVVLANGDSYPGKLVGADPMTDLAVVKISAGKSLARVSFADSDKVQVGQWVVAIGDPQGFAQTVTHGIISAKHRAGITDPSNYQDFLQTDAAINPGNSGGPLLDLYGRVLGVNAVIASTSGGFQGIGFAIPSNMATRVLKQLVATGKVERGWLGVTVQDITPELSHALGIDTTTGALVSDVLKGGPADAAGVQRGDVVTVFDGRPVEDANALRNDAATSAVGSAVNLSVLRKGKTTTVKVKIGSLQAATRLLSTTLRERVGASIGPVPPEEATKFGLKPGEGVVIERIDPNGPLAGVGLEVKDIVLEVNGASVGGLQEFIDVVTSLPPSSVVALLALDHRTGNTGYVHMRLR